MLKAALFGTILAAMTVSAAWALPASPGSKLEASTSNVIDVGKGHGKWGHHSKRRSGYHGKRHWRGHRHAGRYWRHRYHYRPRHWWGCIQAGPVWYCP